MGSQTSSLMELDLSGSKKQEGKEKNNRTNMPPPEKAISSIFNSQLKRIYGVMPNSGQCRCNQGQPLNVFTDPNSVKIHKYISWHLLKNTLDQSSGLGFPNDK